MIVSIFFSSHFQAVAVTPGVHTGCFEQAVLGTVIWACQNYTTIKRNSSFLTKSTIITMIAIITIK